MTKDEFTKWFYTHVDEMVDAGILHPDSAAAKWVRLSLGAAIGHYESRIIELENRLAELDGRAATKREAVFDLPKKQTRKKKPVEDTKQETETPVVKKEKIKTTTSSGWIV